MPNRSYLKGYRFECQEREAWIDSELCHKIKRSVGSRGDDLELWRHMRAWSMECKCFAEDPCKFVSKQLEKRDFFTWKWDRSLPIVACYRPKLIEFITGEGLK